MGKVFVWYLEVNIECVAYNIGQISYNINSLIYKGTYSKYVQNKPFVRVYYIELAIRIRGFPSEMRVF